MRRRSLALVATAALVAGPLALTSSPVVAQTAADGPPRSVTLVGSLQSELGCDADWDPACDATHLAPDPDGRTWSRTVTLPPGSYDLKVALDDSWDVSYGADGVLDGADMPLRVGGEARLRVAWDAVTHRTAVTPLDVPGGTTGSDTGLARDSLRGPLTRERFYFVMADRFANGDRANDRGGLAGGRLSTGYDPSDKAFYHGGDLAGLTQRLDYIEGQGTTAIWLTPSFANKPVQGRPGEESAGYHGYWVTDFTRIDPHLGSNAEMKALIKAAHGKGMKVFFDIITNHTADVIDYEEGRYTYRSKQSAPYRDAGGTIFDDRDVVGRPFPVLDPRTSFPYTPVLRGADATAKTPSWLNDPTMYHNRGDSTFAGESSTYGDFSGLDDLFTERPEVVDGMSDIYRAWVDLGIDGFRIDTVKHVNMEFWQQFAPAIQDEATRVGNKDFFAFGEVYDGNPQVMSEYTTTGRLQATLDFGFQQQAVDFARGKPATALADLFAKDDWYTDADSNAYQLPTFLGNHDMGRAAMFLQEGARDDADHLARVELAQSLMYTMRGNPVTYYGDEQGLVGTGGDQLARQDMFASQVDVYNGERVLGGPSGSRDRYGTDHPLYRHLEELAAMRAAHPALADGAQVQRYAAEGDGIFAVSRVDRGKRVEYLVAANSARTTQRATVDTWTKGGSSRPGGRYDGAYFAPVTPGGPVVRPDRTGRVSVSVPPMSVRVWRASAPMSTDGPAPEVTLAAGADHAVDGRAEIAADVEASTFAQTTFLYREVGTSTWRRLGTDDNAPFRVFHDVRSLPRGTLLEYRAVVRDAGGRVAASSDWASVTPPSGGGIDVGDPPETQPGAVSVPGTHNSEMGCAGDWEPACAQAQLRLDPADQIWKGSHRVPAGPYSYKAALDRSWTENYGDQGVRDGPNISYETDGEVTFYYDPTTHWATSDAQTTLVTLPGSFQSELGCPRDGDAACMRPWLQDKDGDGTYSWATTQIPPGTWTYRVAEDLAGGATWGEGGSPTGRDLEVTVPSAGATTTFVYDAATHAVTVSSG